MTPDQKSLFRSHSTSQEFLFCKADAKPADGPAEDAAPVELGKLTKAFPDILAGKAFRDQAMAGLDGSSKFVALAVRIDGSGQTDPAGRSKPAADARMAVAKTIDTVCKSANGIWGLLDGDIFGCFFPDNDESKALELVKSIKTYLAERGSRTVSIGIAVYPLIDFLKAQVLDNVRKALDHAAFFGPGSSALFDAVSLNISGDTFYQKKDIDGAIAEFKTALRLDPSNVNVHNSLGVCYGVLGDFKRAEAEFEETIRLDPAETMAIYNLGLVYLLTNNKKKALEYFLKAREQAEDVFEVAFQTGKLYLEMGKPEEGKRFLEKAVSLKPESGLAFRFLGECCAAMNLTAEAVSAYKTAIRQNPNDADSLSALGYLFDLQGENPEITTIFCQQSIDISPENSLFRYRLGSLYLKRNLLKEALEQFQKADELGHDAKKIIKKVRNLMQAV
ncbi:MAG: tetratricopeptide repeat protein [Pseudomonadota bacterium]|uniref:Tetratricopeptide repeat protein n=1 Tax=Candidatus Desulfatibia profunda TaxID=2841695 RepID=A0A8J6TGW2_9BACT|nr:tetratricopeptide repeat protein [Candidatus Desulfatibia profunda]MBL7181095.1 tetratricopeptide repeat protein [Desulfobacterales bacterium]